MGRPTGQSRLPSRAPLQCQTAIGAAAVPLGCHVAVWCCCRPDVNFFPVETHLSALSHFLLSRQGITAKAVPKLDA
jgi:hypothetical protein